MDARAISIMVRQWSLTAACLLGVVTPFAGHAEDKTITTTVPIWGDWQPAPGYPGIKIRVICQTYHPETGEAEWNFQFQNTYGKRVHLVYQQEAANSTGNPPEFVVPDGHDLAPKEESPVYTDALKGSCEERKLIYIGVVSIDQKKPVPAKTHTEVAASNTAASNVPTSSAILPPPTNPIEPPKPPQDAPVPVPPPPARTIFTATDVHGSWRCVYPETPNEVHTLKLENDGFAIGFAGITTWTMRANSLNWDDNDGRFRFKGTFHDTKTLDGTVSVDSDYDVLPYHKQNDTMHCTHQ
jgi:hypothetical protein